MFFKKLRVVALGACQNRSLSLQQKSKTIPGNRRAKVKCKLSDLLFSIAVMFCGLVMSAPGFAGAVDPGVRGGASGAGSAIAGLTSSQQSFFSAGLANFVKLDGIGDGLGPRFNLDSCAGCHAQPAVGGTSPSINPQVALATADGAQNTVPSFITSNGPVREARFVSDGGVHDLYVISGRIDSTGNASGCSITQPNFANQLQNNNVIFRIPTPTFGIGLIEAIPDATLVSNLTTTPFQKSILGISGSLNRSGNDGTITRFGWKAQNKSGQIFSGEAYNVEIGISNESFPQERDETPSCQFASEPNDTANPNATTVEAALSDVDRFAFFMRTLAPPTPSTTTPGGSTSISNGRSVFSSIGCAQCHTPAMETGSVETIAALENQKANLFSDLALHHMGPGLADGISQGLAAGDQFRTAPLWGLGQRIFFLHDGRTSNLLVAIQAHSSGGNSKYPSSEANSVISNFNELSSSNQQDLLNFLRSL
ncbi:MAG: di-heme oxidoredictase family protein [Sulfuricaulis sp.]